MKLKIISPLSILILILSLTSSQNSYCKPFYVGDQDVNITAGYGSPLVFRDGYKTNMIPVGISFDYGLSDRLGPGVITIGGYLGATTYSEEIYNRSWEPVYGRKGTLIAMTVRSSYHYEIVNEIDTYGFLHLGLGYEAWNSYGELPQDADIDLDANNRFVIGVGIGAKYYFSGNLSVLAEIGYSTAFFKLGIGIRL